MREIDILRLEFDMDNMPDEKRTPEWKEAYNRRAAQIRGLNTTLPWEERCAILAEHEMFVEEKIFEMKLLLPKEFTSPFTRRDILIMARKNQEFREAMQRHAYTFKAIKRFMVMIRYWKGPLRLKQCTHTWKTPRVTKYGGRRFRCKHWSIRGRHVCRFHGGKALMGVLNHMTKIARYSKAVPHGLSDRYEKSRLSDDLLELQEEIALLDARSCELLEKLESGESRPGWVQAKQAFERWELAMRRQDYEGAQVHVEEMRKALYRKNDSAVWAELQMVFEQRRKLVETERKRQTELENLISVQEFLQIMHQLVWILREEVTDPAAMKRISAKITTLVHAPVRIDAPKPKIYEDPIEVEVQTQVLAAPAGN
jgi:hypothetical protein